MIRAKRYGAFHNANGVAPAKPKVAPARRYLGLCMLRQPNRNGCAVLRSSDQVLARLSLTIKAQAMESKKS
jgi:hypothetical protein